jgi:hypothetical protein
MARSTPHDAESPQPRRVVKSRPTAFSPCKRLDVWLKSGTNAMGNGQLKMDNGRLAAVRNCDLPILTPHPPPSVAFGDILVKGAGWIARGGLWMTGSRGERERFDALTVGRGSPGDGRARAVRNSTRARQVQTFADKVRTFSARYGRFFGTVSGPNPDIREINGV